MMMTRNILLLRSGLLSGPDHDYITCRGIKYLYLLYFLEGPRCS